MCIIACSAQYDRYTRAHKNIRFMRGERQQQQQKCNQWPNTCLPMHFSFRIFSTNALARRLHWRECSTVQRMRHRLIRKPSKAFMAMGTFFEHIFFTLLLFRIFNTVCVVAIVERKRRKSTWVNGRINGNQNTARTLFLFYALENLECTVRFCKQNESFVHSSFQSL